MEAGNRTGEAWVGVDLGARVDRSAIVVVEALQVRTLLCHGEPVGEANGYDRQRGDHTVPVYARTEERRHDGFEVAEIIRMDQGAPHSETLARLIDVYARYQPRVCNFDDTGLGVGFHEYVRHAHMAGQLTPMPKGVTFTTQTKYDVISALDRLVDEDRIRVPNIPGADKLRQELQDYRYRYTATGNITTGSATAAAHDDLVIATALAVFPIRWGWRPMTNSYGGVPVSRPCRIVNRTEQVPA
ncbi:MAG: hypothetical protein KY454_09300 [Actinobacteria bacterium]|nr:hypothetical protein [Actinomycetota bacterium]